MGVAGRRYVPERSTGRVLPARRLSSCRRAFGLRGAVDRIPRPDG